MAEIELRCRAPLAAELERLAEESLRQSARCEREARRKRSEGKFEAATHREGETFAYVQVASRLRERAVEIKEGRDD